MILNVESFLVEWWGDLSWESIHQIYVSKHISYPIFLREHVNSMIGYCISRRFATCKEISKYNNWKDNISSNFVGQMSDVILKVHQKNTYDWMLEELELQKFNFDRWWPWIPQLSRCYKTNVKILNCVVRHIIPKGGAFLFAWNDVVIDKYEQLPHISYGVVWKCFFTDNSDIDLFLTHIIKYFLDHNENHYMTSMT